jgi:hypothetical protein
MGLLKPYVLRATALCRRAVGARGASGASFTLSGFFFAAGAHARSRTLVVPTRRVWSRRFWLPTYPGTEVRPYLPPTRWHTVAAHGLRRRAVAPGARPLGARSLGARSLGARSLGARSHCTRSPRMRGPGRSVGGRSMATWRVSQFSDARPFKEREREGCGSSPHSSQKVVRYKITVAARHTYTASYVHHASVHIHFTVSHRTCTGQSAGTHSSFVAGAVQ